MADKRPVVHNGSNFETLQSKDHIDPQSLPISSELDNALKVTTNGLYVSDNFSALGGIGISISPEQYSDANKNDPVESRRETISFGLPIKLFNYVTSEYISKVGSKYLDGVQLSAVVSGEVSFVVEKGTKIAGSDITIKLNNNLRSNKNPSAHNPSAISLGPFRVVDDIDISNGNYYLTSYYSNMDDGSTTPTPAVEVFKIATIPFKFHGYISPYEGVDRRGVTLGVSVTIKHNGIAPFKSRVLLDSEIYLRSVRNV